MGERVIVEVVGRVVAVAEVELILGLHQQERRRVYIILEADLWAAETGVGNTVTLSQAEAHADKRLELARGVEVIVGEQAGRAAPAVGAVLGA